MNRACIILAAVVLLSASSAFAETIAEVKSSANWMQVTVEGILTYIEPEECYIEATDRSGGIWVQAPTAGFAVGAPVIAIGTYTDVPMGEPIVLDASLYWHGQKTVIRPFGMTNAAIGGTYKYATMSIWDFRRGTEQGDPPTWVPMRGAYNTGLLVKTWGTVKALYSSPVNGASWLYVDDGSGVVSDLGDAGVLVYSDSEVSRGDVVSVQGVSSCERSQDDPGRLIRVLRTRDAADVVVLKAYEPVYPYPFSDEFSSRKIDKLWFVVPGSGVVSTPPDAGWLVLTAQPERATELSAPQLIQEAPGDWDLEIKTCEQLGQQIGTDHRLLIALKGSELAPLGWVPPPSAQYDYLAYTSHGGGDACSLSHKVYLGYPNGQAVTMPGDKCYFRFRLRGATVFANVSFNGSVYLPQDVAIPVRSYYPFLAICATSSYSLNCGSQRGVPFTAYIDYVRFTRVGPQGGSH